MIPTITEVSESLRAAGFVTLETGAHLIVNRGSWSAEVFEVIGGWHIKADRAQGETHATLAPVRDRVVALCFGLDADAGRAA